MVRFLVLVPLLTVLFVAPVSGGTVYEVTSKSGDKVVTYRVKFGGGRAFDQYTAYDPASQKFVYLSWPRKLKAPKPACTIWDHETGRKIELYKFPDVENPLPVIPSMEAMKICPKTGDRNFTSKRLIIYD